MVLNDIHIHKLIRSNRKTIGLEIHPGGALVVRIPHSLRLEKLEGFLVKKRKWIQQKQDLARKKTRPEPTFAHGQKFLFLGRYYPLRFKNVSRFTFDDAFYMPQHEQPKARVLFIAWYKRQARAHIGARTEHLAGKIHISYSKVTITSAAKRWGSCSANGNLNFPYRLVMAPPPVIDYVIVHELIHILERNHAKPYWEKVETAMPDYKKYKAWLKDHGHLLVI